VVSGWRDKSLAVLVKNWLTEDGQKDHSKLRSAEVRPIGFVNTKRAVSKNDFGAKLRYYTTDPSFTNVKPIKVPDSQSSGENSMTFSACWFGILLFGMIRMRKKITVTVILCLIIVSLFLSCGIQITDPPVKSPFAPSAIEHRQTVENLQSNTQYYWKVVAIGSEGINSESIVQTFSTKD
jgi:hypothetical protein